MYFNITSYIFLLSYVYTSNTIYSIFLTLLLFINIYIFYVHTLNIFIMYIFVVFISHWILLLRLIYRMHCYCFNIVVIFIICFNVFPTRLFLSPAYFISFCCSLL